MSCIFVLLVSHFISKSNLVFHYLFALNDMHIDAVDATAAIAFIQHSTASWVNVRNVGSIWVRIGQHTIYMYVFVWSIRIRHTWLYGCAILTQSIWVKSKIKYISIWDMNWIPSVSQCGYIFGCNSQSLCIYVSICVRVRDKKWQVNGKDTKKTALSVSTNRIYE